MAFSEQQAKQLSSKLSPKHVRTREANGRVLAYIEGWHAIAEANRIFGFDGWDRETLSEACVWSGKSGQMFVCAYVARVRISVRAGGVVIRREGSGSGEAKALTPGQAHENALKAAETDATKRALATFGNPFGLALYDSDLVGVRGGANALAKLPKPDPAPEIWQLRSERGDVVRALESGAAFADALETRLKGATTIEMLFDLWGQNLDCVARLKDEEAGNATSKCADDLIALFKEQARILRDRRYEKDPTGPDTDVKANRAGEVCAAGDGIDKSTLALSEPRRIRCKAHLEHVAKQPCLVCGRKPAKAHHVRYAQPRALASKVSDEFTVPLCTTHHDAVHRAGDERKWWRERSVDPLAVAAELWARHEK